MSLASNKSLSMEKWKVVLFVLYNQQLTIFKFFCKQLILIYKLHIWYRFLKGLLNGTDKVTFKYK